MPDPARDAPRNLAGWLAFQERLHPKSVALGLERVHAVAQPLGLLAPGPPTLTVAGTNGKGSSVALAEGIYRAQGLRVGAYFSPHLLRYNERVLIDGEPVSDDALCGAFEAVDRARRGQPLTYFEFGTLAALWLFREARVEARVLEVGLGGRLDAVNIVDADCALITNVGLDHTDWLGTTREAIGAEKAGILRAGRPAVCAEDDPPASVLARAHGLGAGLRRAGHDFHWSDSAAHWSFHGRRWRLSELPHPGLDGTAQVRNAAGVLAALEALGDRLPVTPQAVRVALPSLFLPGRFERRGRMILDVAHNAEAARILAQNLAAHPARGQRWLVLGMLSDKPARAVVESLAGEVQHLCLATLPGPRGLSAEALADRLGDLGEKAERFPDVVAAVAAVRSRWAADDELVVCGSFLTVAAMAGET